MLCKTQWEGITCIWEPILYIYFVCVGGGGLYVFDMLSKLREIHL